MTDEDKAPDAEEVGAKLDQLKSKLNRLKFGLGKNKPKEEVIQPEPEPVVEEAKQPEPEIEVKEPDQVIEETKRDFESQVNLQEEPAITDKEQQQVVESLLEPIAEPETSSNRRYSFNEFIDERILVSRDSLGSKEMKIKILEVSDETPPSRWKFGDRVKVTKILVTIKHLDTQEVEEGEFDIEAIEKELAEKRHYSSTNRWIPGNDVKNGYVIGSRHVSLISDAVALDYIAF